MPNDFDTSQYPLGSTHPYVLYNNAGNEDLFVNDVVNETFVDRPPFSRARKTLYGMEQAFLRFMADTAYENPPLVYVDGTPLQVDRPTQVISRGGNLYSVKLPSTFPVVLSGTWATDESLLVVRADQALRSELASLLGASLIGAADGTTVQDYLDLVDTTTVTPMQTGAVGGGADDTAAVNAAWIKAKTERKDLRIDRPYSVTHLDWDGTDGVRIVGAGSITGIATDAQRSVITMKNGADLVVDGRLAISAGWKTNYECGLELYTDDAGGFSKFSLYNIIVVGAKIGVRIGVPTNTDALLSEFSAYGGYMYGCPTAWEFIGNQLVGSLIGVHAISSVNGAPDPVTWGALPRTALRVFGGNVKQIGGSALIVDVTDGLLYDIRPIASANPTIGNRYGSIIAVGVDIETASELARFWNPTAIPDIAVGSGCLMLTSCSGFQSQDLQTLITSYDDFSGNIDTRGNPGFNAPTMRTNLTINVGGAACHIWFDESSFGRNFRADAGAVVGGILHFERKTIFVARNLNALGIPSPGTTRLKYGTYPAGRFAAAYNPGLGTFQVPAGGLKDVQIHLNVDQLAERPGSVVSARVDGIPFGYVGTESGRYINAVLYIGDVNAGQVIDVVYTAGGATSGFNFGSTDQDMITFSARC